MPTMLLSMATVLGTFGVSGGFSSVSCGVRVVCVCVYVCVWHLCISRHQHSCNVVCVCVCVHAQSSQ